MRLPIPANEEARLRILNDYAVLDTEPDDELDKIVALASAICEAPIALVSLVDETRQWFKAKVGMAAAETPREQAFCAHVIAEESDELFAVKDARLDPRFEENPLVTGGPQVVFYAGAPLVVEDGVKIGTLCVIDSQPRELSETQKQAIETLAEVVVAHLQRRRDVLQQNANEAWLRAILGSMSEAVVATDAAGVVTYLNPVAETLTGYSSAEAVGTVLDTWLPLSSFETQEPVNALPTHGADGVLLDRSTRLLMRTRGGEEIPVEGRATPIRNAAGTLSGVNLVLRDIRAEVRTEQAKTALEQREKVARVELGASEERLRRVVEASGTGTWEIDLTTRRVVLDSRHQALSGYEAEVGTTVEAAIEAIDPRDRDLVREALDAAVAGRNGGVYSVEYRTQPQDDQPPRWVASRGKVLHDEEGRPTRLAGASLDVTGRRQADDDRLEAARRVTEILETMGDAFFALDREFRIVGVNRHFEVAGKTTRAEVLGTTIWDAFPHTASKSSKYYREYHRCMTERIAVQFLDYYPQLAIWTDVRAFPTTDGGIAVFFRDVTAEQRSQEQLRSQAEFEQQLIGIVSHDLRTPLNVITLGSQLLMRREELSAGALKTIVRIANSAERATGMVRDLLDFTQARLGGGIGVFPKPTDLATVLRPLIEEIEGANPDRKLEVRFEGETTGEWDADRIAQVVQNLVTNALKYSPDDSVVKIAARAEPATNQVSLVVHNQGPPIEAEKLPVLFEPFQRAVGSADNVSRSVGLGLYIVRQLVEAHHGTVTVQSTAAEGTTFVVKLPRTNVQAS